MSETNDVKLSAKDEADLAGIGISSNDPTERSIAAVWVSLFENVETVSAQRIPINVAAAVAGRWPFLKIQDTALYHEYYHQLLGECGEVVRTVVEEHPGCLDWHGDDDAEHNHPVYLDILVHWNILLDSYEEEWDAQAADSHIWMAVIPDVRASLFSAQGYAGHLDVIGYQLSEETFLSRRAELLEVNGE